MKANDLVYKQNQKRKKTIRRDIYYHHKLNDDFLFLKKYYYYRFLELEYNLEFNLKSYEDKWCNRWLYPNSKIDRIILKEFHNERQRLYRCQKRLSSMFRDSDYMWFLTFTIDNKHIDKYQNNPRLLVSYISQFFKDYRDLFLEYVFNIDYGSINGRIHVHCVCSTLYEHLDYLVINSYYKLGNLDFIRCYNDKSEIISKYITKLSYHAFKNTAYLQCHYSRKRKK